MAAERGLMTVLLQMVSEGVDDDTAWVFLRCLCKETGQSPMAMASALAEASTTIEDVANPFLLAIVNKWIKAVPASASDRAEICIDLRRYEGGTDRSQITIDLTDIDAIDAAGTQSVRRGARLWRMISPR